VLQTRLENVTAAIETEVVQLEVAVTVAAPTLVIAPAYYETV
jgi:hypothetical protein